jgi:hypothetical protein
MFKPLTRMQKGLAFQLVELPHIMSQCSRKPLRPSRAAAPAGI